MAELRKRDVPLWESFARALGFGDEAIQRFELRQMGEKSKAQEEAEAFRSHLAGGGNILDAPLPGANPEVPDLGTGMAGVIMAGGGQALPPGIARKPLSKPQAPGSRSYQRSGDEMAKAMGMTSQGRGFASENFPFRLKVKITWPDGTVHRDEIKGLNKGHALTRARANWPDASFIEGEAVPAREPKAPGSRSPDSKKTVTLYRGGPKGNWWTSSREVAEHFGWEHALANGLKKPIISKIEVPEHVAREASGHPRVLKSAIPDESAHYLPSSYTEKLIK